MLFKSLLEPSWAEKMSPNRSLPWGIAKTTKTHFLEILPNLAAKSVENDPKMASQNDPKATKNRCQKMIKILIDFKIGATLFLDRPGGMRWPPGGIIGGAKNTLFEIWHIMA